MAGPEAAAGLGATGAALAAVRAELAQDRQGSEVAAGRPDGADAEIHRDPALAGPVHVLQVEQQRELIDDQGQAGSVAERHGRVAALAVLAAHRDRPDPGEHRDSPHVVMQVLAADAHVPERARPARMLQVTPRTPPNVAAKASQLSRAAR